MAFLGDIPGLLQMLMHRVVPQLESLPRALFERIEEMLYRVLRQVAKSSGKETSKFNEADKHGFQIFRKIAKELGLVIPRTGSGGQRFVLPPQLLRFLVAALVEPGERVRLTKFYARVFCTLRYCVGVTSN